MVDFLTGTGCLVRYMHQNAIIDVVIYDNVISKVHCIPELFDKLHYFSLHAIFFIRTPKVRSEAGKEREIDTKK